MRASPMQIPELSENEIAELCRMRLQLIKLMREGVSFWNGYALDYSGKYRDYSEIYDKDAKQRYYHHSDICALALQELEALPEEFNKYETLHYIETLKRSTACPVGLSFSENSELLEKIALRVSQIENRFDRL